MRHAIGSRRTAPFVLQLQQYREKRGRAQKEVDAAGPAQST